ncbi:hypothetical protein ACFC6U_19345 [Kitasatospora purpeofusca]|uniref:hypothetical protein n=1 Tax=Kitasatospora purpeofusca TaxID=67352 RepID=UPI0035DE3328
MVMETVVAVVGILSTLSGIGMSIATWRTQVAQTRISAQVAAQDRQRLDAQARADRLAEGAYEYAQRQRTAAAGEGSVAGRGEGRTGAEELAQRAAALVRVTLSEGQVKVTNRADLPVTGLRIFVRAEDVTGSDEGLDLRGAFLVGIMNGGLRWSLDHVAVPVPATASADLRLVEIHVEFVDADGNTWRRRASGSLFQLDQAGAWQPVPVIFSGMPYIDDDPANWPQAYPAPDSYSRRVERQLRKMVLSDAEYARLQQALGATPPSNDQINVPVSDNGSSGSRAAFALLVLGVSCLLYLLIR